MRPVKTSLPYYQFTREMFSRIKQHKIKGTARDVFDFLSLNQTIKRGKIQPLTIEHIAEEVGCKERSVYYALAKLEKAGLYLPEKWGRIDGYMPMTQLANSTIKQSKHDKQHRLFYQELQKRIDKIRKKRNGPLPSRFLESEFVRLVKERHEAKKFYPEIDDVVTPQRIQEEMDLYLQTEKKYV